MHCSREKKIIRLFKFSSFYYNLCDELIIVCLNRVICLALMSQAHRSVK